LQCRECRESAAAQQAVWSALDSWEPERISTSFDEAVYARIAAEGTQPLTRWPLRQAVPVAAACVAVLAGYLLREPAQQPVREPAVAVENRVDMEQVERALDDIDMLRQMGVAVPAS
jgi:hypothetical protein